MIRVVVIEDELEGREFLVGILNEYYHDVEVVGQASNAIEGLKCIRQLQPNLIFLDINMPGGSGFDMLEALGEESPFIIINSAYEQHALKAHKHNKVHDYLLKPIDLDDLSQSLERLRPKLLTAPLQQRLKIPFKDGFRLIELNEIIFIKGEANYSRIYTHEKDPILVSLPLKHFETTLKQPFIKCHKSYMINTDSVKLFSRKDGLHVIMNGGFEVPVSRRMKDAVINQLK